MKELKDFSLDSFEDLVHGNGAKENVIADAEKELELTFCHEYKQYLLKYGLAMVNGHELSGISNNKRTNVVDLTKKYNDGNEIYKNKYVIEDTNIDGITIWQDVEGIIYLAKNNKVETIANSLISYIEHY